MDIVERIEENIIRIPECGCWIWNRSDSCNGYGRLRISGKDVMAHRVSYEAYVGKIPYGMQLDHLCRVRSCVNPYHLEPVTQSENSKRGLTGKHKRPDICRKGHDYSITGFYLNKRGHRHCLECMRENTRKWKAKNRE